MNNPIFIRSVKVFDTLRNNKGKYSEKNETLVNLAEIAIKLNIGCNFVLNMEYSNDTYYEAIDGCNYDYHDNSKILKLAEVINFFECLSITMNDRCFIVSHNKQNQPILACMPKSKFLKTVLVRDKSAITEKSVEVKNVFDSNAKKTIKQQTSKGVRPINETEINQLKTAFNNMLGSNYNKELVVVNKKEKSA